MKLYAGHDKTGETRLSHVQGNEPYRFSVSGFQIYSSVMRNVSHVFAFACRDL